MTSCVWQSTNYCKCSETVVWLVYLEQTDLIQIYANSGKVFAVTNKGEYVLRLRSYETEKRLTANQFIRISNSEIINLKRVNHFDLGFTGTICVKLSNGTTTHVSGRYVPKLKNFSNNAPNRIFCILDGTQRGRFFDLLRNLCLGFCNHMDNSVCHGQA